MSCIMQLTKSMLQYGIKLCIESILYEQHSVGQTWETNSDCSILFIASDCFNKLLVKGMKGYKIYLSS